MNNSKWKCPYCETKNYDTEVLCKECGLDWATQTLPVKTVKEVESVVEFLNEKSHGGGNGRRLLSKFIKQDEV